MSRIRTPDFWWAQHSDATRQLARLLLQTPVEGNGVATKPWLFGDKDRRLVLHGGSLGATGMITDWLWESPDSVPKLRWGQPARVQVSFLHFLRRSAGRGWWTWARPAITVGVDGSMLIDRVASNVLVLIDQVKQGGLDLDGWAG